MAKRSKDEIEDTMKKLVFKVEGYVEVEVDLDNYDDGATEAVKEMKDEIKTALESHGYGDSSFVGTIEYAPSKKIKKTVELIDED